nr:ABC transporter substrate-binding protein [Haloprofundus marisrubri]
MLQGLGVAGIASVAGCSSGGNGGDGSGNQSGDGSGNQSGDGSDGGQSSQGGQLKMGLVKSPLEFDPIVLNDVPSEQVASQIFEGLYEYNESTGLVPALAASEAEVNDEGTVYTLQIEENATFQNGDPVTSEDVKYSFEAPVNEETENASEVNMIDTIDTPDEKTVVFNLSYPYGAFTTTLAWPIVPKSVREEDPDAFSTSMPVGSGPFQFDEWQEGQYVRISRYDDYWGEPMPNLSGVEFVPVEEATTRVTTLRQGENDIIEEIPPQLYSTVEQIQDASIQEVPGIGYFYLAFNCANGPTTDPLVREAVDYCFDMDQAVSNYVEPTGVRQYSPLPAALADEWGFDVGQWEQIPHGKDINQAQSLFEEAGVSQDYSWRIIVPPDDKREQIGVTVSNGLQEAGFNNVEVQRLDWGAFLEQYVSGNEDDYNMYTLGWSGTPDPDAFTYYMFGATEDTLGVTDGTFYHNSSERAATATEKFVQAREMADQEQRKQLYTEGITTVLEDRAHLPAYNLKNSFGVKEYVNDFAEHPVDSFHLTSNHNNVSVNK